MTRKKEDTWKFDEDEAFNCNHFICDFQILNNLFTPKCFRKVFLVWNLGEQSNNGLGA